MHACERCGAETQLVTVGDWDVCTSCEPKERARAEAPVALVSGAALQREALRLGPLEPTALFSCEHYRCSMMARACLERQAARARPGRNATDQTLRLVWGMKFCQDGTCTQGALIKLRVGDAFVPPPEHRERKRIAQNIQAIRRAATALPPPPAPPPPAIAPERHMPRPSKLDALDDFQVLELKNKYGGNVSAIASEVGCSPPAVKHRFEKLAAAAAKLPPSPAPATSAPPPEPPTETISRPPAGPRVRVELPEPKDLPLDYVLSVVEYAGTEILPRLSAALGRHSEPKAS